MHRGRRIAQAEQPRDGAKPWLEVDATFRAVSELRRDVGELLSLLAQLEQRARATRAAWLTISAGSRSP